MNAIGDCVPATERRLRGVQRVYRQRPEDMRLVPILGHSEHQLPIAKLNRKPSQAPQHVPLNLMGTSPRDLCSRLLKLPAVLDGLRVRGGGNSHRDYEPIRRDGHFKTR